MCIDLLAWKEASYLTDAYSAHNMYTLNLAFEASKDVQSVEEKSTESTLADDLNFLILKVLGPKPCACTAWPTRPSSRICKLPGQALEPLEPQFKSGVAGESIHEGICAVGVQVLKKTRTRDDKSKLEKIFAGWRTCLVKNQRANRARCQSSCKFGASLLHLRQYRVICMKFVRLYQTVNKVALHWRVLYWLSATVWTALNLY